MYWNGFLYILRDIYDSQLQQIESINFIESIKNTVYRLVSILVSSVKLLSLSLSLSY